MVVISDTSPVSNLIVINKLFLLKSVFGKIIIPEAVYAEIMHLESDYDLSEFKQADWIKIEKVNDLETFRSLTGKLDVGEAQAITIAKELHSEYLLIDEQAGRKIAKQMGIRIIGLLGVLVKAKKLGHVKTLKPILHELKTKAQFRMSEELYQEVLHSVGE